MGCTGPHCGPGTVGWDSQSGAGAGPLGPTQTPRSWWALRPLQCSLPLGLLEPLPAYGGLSAWGLLTRQAWAPGRFLPGSGGPSGRSLGSHATLFVPTTCQQPLQIQGEGTSAI